MDENTFNKIEKDLRAEEGIANELDYVEQTSWVLFLKYLHDLENERADRAELDGVAYSPIIGSGFRWDQWAAPKDADGNFDDNAARIGDDLTAFVDHIRMPEHVLRRSVQRLPAHWLRAVRAAGPGRPRRRAV